jgi:tRNA-dihydrouridine synthase B
VASSITGIFRPDRAALAPLAGVTDSVFRAHCAEFGACPVVTEMISVDGYIRSRPGDKTARFLRFRESERPIGFQFFGSDPTIVGMAVERAQELKPDFIDINAGCPVKKVIARGAGSALMRTPETLAAIVAKAVAASRVPVTVKIRAGWDLESINVLDVARRCRDAGAQAIILHPRTRSQGFSGHSDWNLLRCVREELDIPVVGSGDIVTAADALRMKAETGVENVMVGRAAMGNPWIFREIAALFAGEEPPPPPTPAERLELPLRQLRELSDEVSERFAVLNMRKVFGWFTKGMPGGSGLRQRIFQAPSADAVEDLVRGYLGDLASGRYDHEPVEECADQTGIETDMMDSDE